MADRRQANAAIALVVKLGYRWTDEYGWQPRTPEKRTMGERLREVNGVGKPIRFGGQDDPGWGSLGEPVG